MKPGAAEPQPLEEIPSSKSQIPNKFQAPNSKHASDLGRGAGCFGDWNLGFVWNLEFVIWNLRGRDLVYWFFRVFVLQVTPSSIPGSMGHRGLATKAGLRGRGAPFRCGRGLLYPSSNVCAGRSCEAVCTSAAAPSLPSTAMADCRARSG